MVYYCFFTCSWKFVSIFVQYLGWFLSPRTEIFQLKPNCQKKFQLDQTQSTCCSMVNHLKSLLEFQPWEHYSLDFSRHFRHICMMIHVSSRPGLGSIMQGETGETPKCSVDWLNPRKSSSMYFLKKCLHLHIKRSHRDLILLTQQASPCPVRGCCTGCPSIISHGLDRWICVIVSQNNWITWDNVWFQLQLY